MLTENIKNLSLYELSLLRASVIQYTEGLCEENPYKKIYLDIIKKLDN